MIDVLVKPGQQIDKETPMITLETEKAAMDVPAPAAGRIAEVKVKKGDKVSEGSVILLLESTDRPRKPHRRRRRPPRASHHPAMGGVPRYRTSPRAARMRRFPRMRRRPRMRRAVRVPRQAPR